MIGRLTFQWYVLIRNVLYLSSVSSTKEVNLEPKDTEKLIDRVLVFEALKCIGCRICEQWCSLTHFGVSSPAKSRIRIVRDHETQIDNGILCHQCADAPCISSCKFDALSRDECTGAVIVDKEKCTGCRRCIKACPYNAPRMHPEEKHVIICDLCKGDPQCVSHCPEQAVLYLERSKAEKPYRSVNLHERIKGIKIT